MSEPWGGAIPPGHGEGSLGYSDVQPVCPLCERLVRAQILDPKEPGDPQRGAWRCDHHGEVTPRWVYPLEEEEDEP